MASRNVASSYLNTPFHEHEKHTLHIRKGQDRKGKQIEIKEKWKYMKQVATGQCGVIWLQKETSTSKLRAVKEIDKRRIAGKIDYKRELDALMEFSQAKYSYRDLFVQFYGWFADEHHVYMAMEYLPLGGLQQYIPSAIGEDSVKEIAMQVLKGLKYMHEAGYTHRDIKPANILVLGKRPQSPRWHIKLADFGGTKKVRNDETALRTAFGTPAYQAPEITPDFLKDLDYDPDTEPQTNAMDLWSFGCVVYHMMALRVPFPDSPMLYCRAGGEPLPSDPFYRHLEVRTSELCTQFTKSILRPLPSERPTAKDALEHLWLLDLALSGQYATQGPSQVNDSVGQPFRPSEESSATSISSNISTLPLIPNVAKQKQPSSQPIKYDQLAHRRPPRNQYLHRRPPDSKKI